MDFLKKFTDSAAPKTDSTTDKAAPPSEENQSSLFASANIVADAARSTFQREQPKHDNAKVAGAAADILGAAQSYGKLDKTSGLGSYVDKAQTYLEDYGSSHATKPAAEAPQDPKYDEPATKPATTEESAPKPSSEEIPTDPVKPTSEERELSSEEPKQEEEEPVKEATKPSSEDIPTKEEEPKHQPSTEETEPTTESAKPATHDEPKHGGKEEEEEEVAKEPKTEPESEKIPSGAGGYAKIAEGFLKKDTDGDSAGQIGQYAKAASDFLSKKSEGGAADDDQGSKTGDSDQSGGGFGGLAKLAGGFLK